MQELTRSLCSGVDDNIVPNSTSSVCLSESDCCVCLNETFESSPRCATSKQTS